MKSPKMYLVKTDIFYTKYIPVIALNENQAVNKTRALMPDILSLLTENAPPSEIHYSVADKENKDEFMKLLKQLASENKQNSNHEDNTVFLDKETFFKFVQMINTMMQE